MHRTKTATLFDDFVGAGEQRGGCQCRVSFTVLRVIIFRTALVAPLHQGLRPASMLAAPWRAASTTCRTAVITRSGSVIWMSCPLLVAITCWAPGASAAKASWSSRHTFSCAAT